MGRERHPTPVVAVLSATAGRVPDLTNPNFGEVAKAVGLWGHIEGRQARGIRSDVARTARPSAAAGQGETDAVGDATLALCFAGAVVGMAVYSAKAPLQGKGGDVREMLVRGVP